MILIKTLADFVSVYIDDILVFSRTLEEHLYHLQLVLQHVIKAGLKLRLTSAIGHLHSFVEEQRKDSFICEIILLLETDELPHDVSRARKIALQSNNFILEDKLSVVISGLQVQS